MTTNFITGYTTLRILRLGGNILGDDGMKLVMEGFPDRNTLVDLAVWNCKLSGKGRLVVNAATYKLQEISPADLDSYYLLW